MVKLYYTMLWTNAPNHSLHKKQQIPYPLTTKEKEGSLETEGSRKGFLVRVAGKSLLNLPHLPMCNRNTIHIRP